MKKFLALLLAVMMVLSLAACGKKADTPIDTSNPDSIPDTMTSADGKYEVAFVTDVGALKDKSFNQGTYDGVKLYSAKNNASYKYYQPSNGDKATDKDREDAMNAACDAGAKVVVCAGFLQETALVAAATAHPDVKFLFIDGYPVGCDNVAPIAFKEHECGYFAGYAAVKEGYTKLGFSGGGGGTNPACCRYGYGFVQGANAAAAELGKTVEMNYSWAYGETYGPSQELKTMLEGWYTNGTEVVFACGGRMCDSAFAAASANNGHVIGVDVDQSSESDTVITSAMKGLSDAVEWAVAKIYAGEWADIGGVPTSLGAAENATGLPTATWSMQNFTVDQYNQLFKDVVDGKVTIDDDYTKLEQAYSNLTLNVIA